MPTQGKNALVNKDQRGSSFFVTGHTLKTKIIPKARKKKKSPLKKFIKKKYVYLCAMCLKVLKGTRRGH